jgi:quinol monooxygenase YgiN
MLTALFHMTARPGEEEAHRELLVRLAAGTRAHDAGCLASTFLRQRDAPGAFVLYEQWRDRAALDAHLARLQAEYGPPPPGPSRVPAAVLAHLSEWRAVVYDIVA